MIISSDSEKILNLIQEDKKLIKLKRNKKLALDNTPMIPVMQDAINILRKNNFKYYIDFLIIVDPTSPLRKLKDIDKAIFLFKKKRPDLLVSVHEAQHNPYFSILEKRQIL